MIVVTGDVVATPETIGQIRLLSIEHVERSRLEDGCISHGVHVDVQNPMRFVFVERWADWNALQAHFAVPASRAFARAIAGLAASRPSLQIYEATEKSL
jgi:quinol monooxygenase YgiN